MPCFFLMPVFTDFYIRKAGANPASAGDGEINVQEQKAGVTPLSLSQVEK
jgi:hypothetical protein